MSGDERVNKVEIDGIEWTFVVKDGFAVVGVGSSTAIPQTTSGKIAISLALGGCPVTKIGEGFTPSNPPPIQTALSQLCRRQDGGFPS